MIFTVNMTPPLPPVSTSIPNRSTVRRRETLSSRPLQEDIPPKKYIITERSISDEYKEQPQTLDVFAKTIFKLQVSTPRIYSLLLELIVSTSSEFFFLDPYALMLSDLVRFQYPVSLDISTLWCMRI